MKKILIITYFFPPLGGAGVQRTLKFIKYLPEFNYKPVILTPDHRFVRFIKDETLLKEMPKDAVIYKTPILDINWFFKILYGFKMHMLVRWISEVLFFPDYQRQWLFFARLYVKKILKIENISLVYISSPPHSIQTLGVWIKKKYNIPFVADFRDPLTFNPLNKYRKLYNRYYEYEKNILVTADCIISNTAVNKNTYIEKFGTAEGKITTITNGYDNADFSLIKKKQKKNVKIIFSHIGRLYTNYNASPLLNALSQIKSKLDNIEIRFVGSIPDSDIKLIKQFDLSPYIKLIPSCSHENALIYGQESDYLIVILAENQFLNFIPGKTFEYIRLGVPILAIVPEKGSCAEIIRETNTGVVISPNNLKNISETILNMIENHNNYPYHPVHNQIQKYDRKYLTGKLAAVFNKLIELKENTYKQVYSA